MNHEYERIEHSVVKNFKLFLVDLSYRTNHIHKDFEICFILNGSLNIKSREKKVTARKNDFFVINPFQPHELSADEQTLILSVQIPPEFCRDYYPVISNTEFSFLASSSVLPQDKTDKIFGIALKTAEYYFSSDKGFELLCTSEINRLLYELISVFPHSYIEPSEQKRNMIRYERARRLTDYIHGNYTERLFLSQLAERERLSLTYLSHFFKEYFQMSFQDYLQSVRCEKARQLLLNTNLNMLEITIHCGFSDIKYLNKAFLKRYGCLPKEFRKRCAEDVEAQDVLLQFSEQKFFSRRQSLGMIEKYIN